MHWAQYSKSNVIGSRLAQGCTAPKTQTGILNKLKHLKKSTNFFFSQGRESLNRLLQKYIWMISLFLSPLGFIEADEATSILHGVIFEGAEGVPRSELLAWSGLKVGAQTSEAQVQSAIKKLVASKLIAEIEILPALRDADGFTLKFRVSTFPILDAIHLHIPHDQDTHYLTLEKALNPELQTLHPRWNSGLKIRPGMILDLALREEVKERLKDWYQREGYLFCEIDESLTPVPHVPGRVTWRISVDEGRKFYLKELQFSGNDSISARDLTAVLKNRPQRLWGLFSPGHFNPSTWPQDLEAMRKLYRDRGFLNVHLAQAGMEVDYKRGTLILKIDILEGKRYSLKGIQLKGHSSMLTKALDQQIKTEPGGTFNGVDLEADRARLLLYYMKRLYKTPSITLEHLYSLDPPDEVTAVFDIDERNHLFTGKIFIEGNTYTRDRVILSALHISPGDPITPIDVIHLANRIKALGHFEDVTVETRPAPDRLSPFLKDPEKDTRTQPGVMRDLYIKVIESKSGLFEVGGGASSGKGEIFSIMITQKNFDWLDWPGGKRGWKHPFSGGGQKLQAQILPGTKISEFRLLFEEPYVYSSKTAFSFDLSNQLFRWRDFEENQFSGELGFRHLFDKERKYSAFLGLHLEDVHIKDVEPGTVRDIADLEGHTRLAYPTLKLGFDNSLHNDYVGQTGLRYIGRVDASLEELGTESRFLRTVHQVDYGVNTTKFSNLLLPGDPFPTDIPDLAHRLKLGFRAGWIEGLQGDDVPFFERFRMGGPRNFRGFDYYDMGPRAGGIPIGGEAFWMTSVDYSFPLYWRELRMSVLFDVGDLEEKFSKFSSDRIRTSAGIGLHARFKLYGLDVPVSFYFVEALRKQRQDDPRFFSFTLGLDF